jgi:plasmid stabilization system protein ParE
MRTVVFQADAEAEMIEAAAYYETRQRNLGRRFLAAVQDSLNRIVINPQLYPLVELDVRRCLTRTFPFGVLFRDRLDKLEVIAIMHLRRDPDCWKER